MKSSPNSLLLFVTITILWSCFIGLLIYVLGLSVHSAQARIIMALLYMPSPAIITLILHRFKFTEIIRTYGLNVREIPLKRIISTSILFFTLYFISFIVITLLTGNLLHLPGFGQFATSSDQLKQELLLLLPEMAGQQIPDFPSVTALLITTYLSGLVAGFTINMLFAFGEELGWRGYLWDRLKQLGRFKSNILIGLIWGIWHAPIILQGYNYPGFPIWGVLFMILFTIALTFPLTSLRDYTKSVWTAAVIHGMINATGVFSFVVVQKNVLLAGTTGITGIISILFAWIITVQYLKRRKSDSKDLTL